MIHTSRQLKALVRNRSHGDNAKAMTLIRNFVMERFDDKSTFYLPRQDILVREKSLKIRHFLCSLSRFTNISGESDLRKLRLE